MKLVVGLGNPGEKYKNNRHNTGFIILDEFTRKQGVGWEYGKKVNSEVTRVKEKDLVLLKPRTFMNDCGSAVLSAIKFFSIPTDCLLVVHDDVDLGPLHFRLSRGSSSAGHRGVQNIIDRLGTQEFSRLRVGIGRPTYLSEDVLQQSRDVEKYVLEDFLQAELESVKKLGVEHLLSSLNV